MVHPDTTLVWIDDVVGHGVIATAPIPRGTLVWAQDRMDQSFHPAELDAMTPVLRVPVERYSYRDHTGQMVLCWDLAKYFNHSCEANCLGLDFPFEIAVRDIAPGEQLTDDYGSFYLLGAERFACRCGAPQCRGAVTPEDRYAAMPRWVEAISAALARLDHVAQPLIGLLDGDVLAEVRGRFGVETKAAATAAVSEGQIGGTHFNGAAPRSLRP
jgi:hypothetical protein